MDPLLIAPAHSVDTRNAKHSISVSQLVNQVSGLFKFYGGFLRSLQHLPSFHSRKLYNKISIFEAPRHLAFH